MSPTSWNAILAPISEHAWLRFPAGQLAGDAQRQGTPAPVIDGLLAATALHHHLTMVTRNVQDFMIHNNIQAFNPWDTP